MSKMISRLSRSLLVWSLTSASLNHADRLREGHDQCVGHGCSKYVKRAWQMTDTDIMKLVNAVQGTGLAVAWHHIHFHRIDELAHIRSDPEWVVNHRQRSQAQYHPDASVDE